MVSEFNKERTNWLKFIVDPVTVSLTQLCIGIFRLILKIIIIVIALFFSVAIFATPRTADQFGIR